MEEVVVTATRHVQEVQKVPAQVSVITSDQIKASGAQSVPDVLRELGGVIVRDLNGNGNNQVIDMAGFGESADRHVAVLIDGRRVNPIDMSGVRWTLIPVESIERIEVLHGAGSVLYGDNATGGVINIITKEGRPGIHFDGKAGYGNLGTNSEYAAVEFGKGPVSGYVGVSRFRTDGYRDRSETERQSGFGKARLDATDRVSLLFELNGGRAEYELPGSLTEAQMAADRKQSVNPSDEGMDQDFYVGVGSEVDLLDWGLLKFKLSKRAEDRKSNMASWNSNMDIDTDTNGLTGQYIFDKMLWGHSNRLTLGIDYYGVDYKGKRISWSTSLFDHDKDSIAYYVEDEFSLLPNLILNVGARYEKPDFKLRLDTTRYEYEDGETAWNVGIAYSFTQGSKVYGRIYRSFRYPAVDEYTNMFSGTINTGLRQERAMGYEVGTRLWMLSRSVLIDMRLYSMDMEDEIAYNPATYENENLDETRHRGGEINLKVTPVKHLSFYVNAVYTDAKFTKGQYDGNKIPLVPEWKGRAGIELAYGGFRGRIQYNYVDERFFGNDQANEARKMDGYGTLDLYLNYRYRWMDLFLNANNILGKKYSDYGFYNPWGPSLYNYYPMPEAIYFAGIRVYFGKK